LISERKKSANLPRKKSCRFNELFSSPTELYVSNFHSISSLTIGQQVRHEKLCLTFDFLMQIPIHSKMETRAKKMRFERVPNDPLIKLHEFHLQELILQHLNGNQVMESMKVSSIWNKILQNSPKAMSKIKFEFDEEASKPQPKEIVKLLNSKRRCQNMKLAVRHKANFLFLQRFSLSLVDLDVKIDLKKLRNFTPQNLSFPRLKSLRISGDANWLITETFKAPKLTALMISSPDPLGEHFDSFLLRVADSLTKLWIYRQAKVRQFEIAFNQMSKLISLRCIVGEHAKLILQPNHNIIDLGLLYHSQQILANLPNLETYIALKDISTVEAEWIFKNKMKLKKLVVKEQCVAAVYDHYQQLKESIAAVNRNIEISYLKY
jgi:hypothetical protein